MKGLSGQTVDSCLSSGVVQQFPGGRPGATEARHDPEESAAPHERPAGRGLQGRGSHPSRGRCSLRSQAWTQVSLPQRKHWCEGLFGENSKLLGMCLFPNAAFACASWSSVWQLWCLRVCLHPVLHLSVLCDRFSPPAAAPGEHFCHMHTLLPGLCVSGALEVVCAGVVCGGPVNGHHLTFDFILSSLHPQLTMLC